MSAAHVPENFWLLADPDQEVLIAGRPAFSQLAPVPLRQLGTDTITAGEPYRAYTSTPGGSYAPADGDDR
ncbi:hypothetical protein [Jatrophihabitans sp.]|jgi:hypothetical protein|uniref:hypothetical protein n=1 Tax=Jatrophihabitans sp. TaxID=1932789 RepID=UPI002EF6604D